MPVYELTEAADADVQAIARYTVKTWGIEQARRYEAILESHFQAIGREKARSRGFLKHRPDLRVSRIEHHYVFHLVRVKQSPADPCGAARKHGFDEPSSRPIGFLTSHRVVVPLVTPFMYDHRFGSAQAVPG